MTRIRRFHVIILAVAAMLLVGMFTGCTSQHSGHDDYGVWFVHATDPHRYLYTSEDATDAVKKSTAFQELHDRDVLSQFFKRVGTLPQPSGPPAFILITGDFGVDPCLIPDAGTLKKPEKARTFNDCVKGFDAKKRDGEVEEFANLLSASPVRNIYFVAGNNDLPFETADDAGIAYFNQFFDDVQTKISAKNSDVRLHNLTGCYGSKGGSISDCSPDIPGTAYRLIGFPSFSYKNKEAGHENNPALQATQFKTFHDLFDKAIKDGRKVIIATHVPDIDDPYYLARDRYDGVAPEPSIDTDKDNPRSAYSAWNVQKSLLEGWTRILQSDSTVAVVAGHFHDGHKEIYQQPYSWSTLKDYQMGFRKLILAPPLSVKNQDGSPIQARGFSIVSLHSDHVSNRFYWYDGLSASFNPDRPVEPELSGDKRRQVLARWVTQPIVSLWQLDNAAPPLERAATLLIAFLTAFLTVVALWQIPPTDDPLARKPADTNSKGTNADANAVSSPKESSPFTTRFGTTILAGLGGLVVAEVTKTLGGSTPSPDTKWYYIVCFILFFFALLVLLNLLRALTEAMRSRVAVIRYPPLRSPRQESYKYWFERARDWFFSLRVPVLTFFDTFINLIQGKNQTTTQAFTDAIIEQQRNVVHIADMIRKRLTSHLESRLTYIAHGENRLPGHVRVNISAMSADQSKVFYISRSAGSALLPFPKISVAWVSVFTGKIRWYESSYQHKNVVLFENKTKTIPDAPDELMLDSYYEDRDGDYEAFVVLPVPYPQRAFGTNYVKGAIQVSFSLKDDFFSIWNEKADLFPRPAPPPGATGPGATVPSGASLQTIAPATTGPPSHPPATNIPANSQPKIQYEEAEQMLQDWCKDTEVRTALNDAVAVVGELLRGFNEVIYTNYIQPGQGD